jgi:hypothetical protein
MGLADDVPHRVDRPERVGDVHHRHDARARREQVGQPIEQQLAPLVHRDHPQRGPALLAEHLPRDDVRVVLHGGDQHLVAAAHALPAVRAGDEVDALRRAAHEHDFRRGRRVEVARHHGAAPLVGRGGFLAQLVHAPVHVGVDRLVVAVDRVDDVPGLLAGGGVVEIDQRLAAHGTAEQREIRPHPVGVEGGADRRRRLVPFRRRAHGCARPSSRVWITSSKWARSGSRDTEFRISAPKPYVRRLRAAAASMPRL